MKILNKDYSSTSVYLAIGLCILFIGLFYQTFFYLIKTWYSIDHNSHGFIIIPITVYIIYKKREALSAIPIEPSKIGIFVLAGSLLLFYFSNLAGIMSLASFSIILFVAGTVIYLFGLKLFNALLVPMLILCFIIPVPAQIYSNMTMPLQLFVTNVSTTIIKFFNIPVYSEGNVIILPENILEVVEACSGLRSLISLSVLSAIIGYLTIQSNVLRVLLLVSSLPIAIFVNVIRVMFTIVVIYYMNIDFSTGITHQIFGLITFMFALICIFAAKRFLGHWETR